MQSSDNACTQELLSDVGCSSPSGTISKKTATNSETTLAEDVKLN